MKRLLELPGAIREAAERRAPHRIAAYATETAQDFSAFYRDCRVVGAAEEGGDEDVRIAIAVLAKRVLAQALDLLGVEAPDRCEVARADRRDRARALEVAEEVQVQVVHRPERLRVQPVSSFVYSSTPITIRITPETSVIAV